MKNAQSYTRTEGSAPLNTPAKLRPRYIPKAFEVWAGCPRCGFRVCYAELKRERLTGLLVCESCWDPWHPSLDFQTKPDRSIEPPKEPYPARWGFGLGVNDPWDSGYVQAAGPNDEGRARAASTVNWTAAGTPGQAPFIGAPSLGPGDYRPPSLIPDARGIGNAPDPIGYDGIFVPTSSPKINFAPVPPTADFTAPPTNIRLDTPGER